METKDLKKKNYTPSKEELRNSIIRKMTDLGLWKDELLEELPTYWDNFSNFIIFNSKFFVDNCWHQEESQIWKHVSNLFSGKSIALQGKIRNDDFRSPNAHVVFGESPWVEYLDNSIFYMWNVEFTMFCTGNVSERHRIARLDCEGKVVVDMFAGIGYFTLPYLVHAKASKVIACEWNPISVEALKKNLTKNKVNEKCEIFEGDVRVHCPRGVADHINLGLIPSCEQYWSTAAEILKPSGGMLHVHGNVSSFTKGFMVQCMQCLEILQGLSIDTLNITEKIMFDDFQISTLTRDVVCVEKCENKIKWKKIEWFIWGIHTSHEFCKHLCNVTKTGWRVMPIFLHRVKAYAPHIDHLVLDVSCQNMLKPV